MDFLFEILMKDKPSEYVKSNLDKILEIIPELSNSIGFNQKNKWHVYDVFEHIMHVLDEVDNDIELRLAALFHDIGKPFSYTCDEKGVGHFYFHWNKSNEIFLKFSEKYKLDKKLIENVSNLILYHDIRVHKLDDEKLDSLIKIFGKDGIKKLYNLKRSDLLAQNSEFHYLMDELNQQEIKVLNKIKKD